MSFLSFLSFFHFLLSLFSFVSSFFVFHLPFFFMFCFHFNFIFIIPFYHSVSFYFLSLSVLSFVSCLFDILSPPICFAPVSQATCPSISRATLRKNIRRVSLSAVWTDKSVHHHRGMCQAIKYHDNLTRILTDLPLLTVMGNRELN